MRRNIALKFDDKHAKIYFYTHWGAENLAAHLRNALIRGVSRWDNPPYLSRIIFCEMLGDVTELPGVGIAPYETDPEYPTIEVDLEKRTVDGKTFEEFISTDAPSSASTEAAKSD